MIPPRDRPDEVDREDVLRVASRLMTGRQDPHIVLPVADHILNWLTGDGDQDGMAVHPLGDLTHPQAVRQDVAADQYVFDRNFGGRDHPQRLRNRIRHRRDQLLRSPRWLAKTVARALGRHA